MIQFATSPGTPQLDLRIVPSQKIQIAVGTTIYTCWYVRETTSSKDFDKDKDGDVIEAIYSTGMSLHIGDAEPLGIANNRRYRLERVASHVFVLTCLC